MLTYNNLLSGYISSTERTAEKSKLRAPSSEKINLEESKKRVIGLRKVSSEESSGVMNELMFAELVGAADMYYKYEENIKKVSLGDVKRVASEIVKEYSTAAVVPK